VPATSPPSPPSLAAIFDTSSDEALRVAAHPIQALLLVSSTIEPMLAQFADTVRERMRQREHEGLLLFNVLCPPPAWTNGSRGAGDSWVARWTPAADDGWLTRNSDLVLCELASALGSSWSELPLLVVTTQLTSGETVLCVPTSAERFPTQLRALRKLCDTPHDLEQLAGRLDGADLRRPDRQRLRELMGTIDLGLQAWWAERARRELGRPWRDAVDPELRKTLGELPTRLRSACRPAARWGATAARIEGRIERRAQTTRGDVEAAGLASRAAGADRRAPGQFQTRAAAARARANRPGCCSRPPCG
jgi:hypothetical protein